MFQKPAVARAFYCMFSGGIAFRNRKGAFGVKFLSIELDYV